MQQAVKTAGGEHRLTLGEILDGLVEDKVIGADAAEQLKKERRYYRGTLHRSPSSRTRSGRKAMHC